VACVINLSKKQSIFPQGIMFLVRRILRFSLTYTLHMETYLGFRTLNVTSCSRLLMLHLILNLQTSTNWTVRVSTSRQRWFRNYYSLLKKLNQGWRDIVLYGAEFCCKRLPYS